MRGEGEIRQGQFGIEAYKHKEEVQDVDREHQSRPPSNVKEDTSEIANGFNDGHVDCYVSHVCHVLGEWKLAILILLLEPTCKDDFTHFDSLEFQGHANRLTNRLRLIIDSLLLIVGHLHF